VIVTNKPNHLVEMNSAFPCRICGNAGHSPSHCPSLHDVLKEGFYSGGGGGGGHSHDDEDERLRELCKKNRSGVLCPLSVFPIAQTAKSLSGNSGIIV
jgi:hypothetical protein